MASCPQLQRHRRGRQASSSNSMAAHSSRAPTIQPGNQLNGGIGLSNQLPRPQTRASIVRRRCSCSGVKAARARSNRSLE